MVLHSIALEPSEQFMLLFASLAWASVFAIMCARQRQLQKKQSELEQRWNIVENGPITQKGIENIANHKYKSAGWTQVDLILDNWWSLVAKYIPDSLAPNVVTLCGFAAILAGTFTVFYFQPKPHVERPGWIGLFIALTMFLYQTFDAVDGKHARRTGQSSPLGQLFDHGIDGLTLTFATYNIATGHGFSHMQFFIIMTWAQITYYCSQWAERHTHVLATNFGLLGITEVQIITALLGTTTYFFPFSFWSLPFSELFPGASGQINYVFALVIGSDFAREVTSTIMKFDLLSVIVAVIVIGNMWILYCQIVQVFVYYWNLETIEETYIGLKSAFKDLIPFGVFVGIHYWWVGNQTMTEHPAAYLFTIAFLFSHLTNQIIVSGMARDAFSCLQPSLIIFAALVGLERMSTWTPAQASVIAFGLCSLITVIYFRWSTLACVQIATRLNIYVLKPGIPFTTTWQPRANFDKSE